MRVRRRLIGSGAIAAAIAPRPAAADERLAERLERAQARIEADMARIRARLQAAVLALTASETRPVPASVILSVWEAQDDRLRALREGAAAARAEARGGRIGAGAYRARVDECFLESLASLWRARLDLAKWEVRRLEDEHRAEAARLREEIRRGGADARASVAAREDARIEATLRAFDSLAGELAAVRSEHVEAIRSWGEGDDEELPVAFAEAIEGQYSIAKDEGGFLSSALESFLEENELTIEGVLRRPGTRSLADAMERIDVRAADDFYDFFLDGPELRVVSGMFPEEAPSGVPVVLAFRLEKLADYAAPGVRLRLLVLRGKDLSPIEDLEARDPRCVDAGDGAFDCVAGDMAPGDHADFVFDCTMPPDGIRWVASWETADGTGGAETAHGRIEPVHEPRIVAVLPLADQERETYGVPHHPYPFGGPGRNGLDYRTLFVVGRDLPERGDPWETTSQDPHVVYRFVAWPDTDNVHYRELYEAGWARYRRVTGRAPGEALPEDLDGLLMRASLERGILPGDKILSLGGAPGVWSLRFGGLTASLAFVRDKAEPRPLRDVYLPERIHLHVRTSRELPLDAIPLVLYERDPLGTLKPHAIEAFRDPERPLSYVSPPIDLVERGRPHMAVPGGPAALVVPVDIGRRDPNMLFAEVDADFRTVSFRLPVDPPLVHVAIRRSPAEGETSWLFKEALARAARAKGLAVEGWDELSAAEAETITNYVLLTVFFGEGHVRETKIRVGHHAAMLLLRDMFAEMLDRQVPRLEAILQDERKVVGFLNYMSEFWNDERFPVNAVEVKGPDGEATTFGSSVTFDDVPFLAEQYGLPTETIERWRVEATREALTKLAAETRALAEEVRGVDADDVEELLQMTGRGFGPVIEELLPRMMRLQEAAGGARRLYWTPDTDARKWLGEVSEIAAAVRKQRDVANQDTQMTLAAVTLLTMPLMLVESGTVALVTFAIEILDLAITAAIEIETYAQSEWELDFSRRAAVVLGTARSREAKAQAKHWAGMLFSIGMSAAFAGIGGIDAVRFIDAGSVVAKGRALAKSVADAASLERLGELDRLYFGGFFLRSKLAELSRGAETLTDVERRSIALVEELAERQARAVSPDAETAAATLRFRLDMDEGRVTLLPPERAPTRTAAARVPPTPSGRALDLARAETRTTPGHIRVDDARDALAGRALTFRTEQGDLVTMRLRDHVGEGSFTTVYTLGGGPLQGRARVVKFTFDDVVEADEFGHAALTALGSENLRAAERVAVFRPQQAEGTPSVLLVQVTEELPPTLSQTLKRGGSASREQLEALDRALRDLNDSGYAWLDMKTNNFGFERVDGRVVVVVHDPGGIVKVSSPEVARQLQLHVNAPFAQRFPRFPNASEPSVWRKAHILDEFEEHVPPHLNQGRSLSDVEFNPCGGDQLPDLGVLFAAE